MQRLFDFLYQQREIAIFLGLEILSVWLLVYYNNRYNASFFNSSNQVSASIAQTSDNVATYFELDEINQRIMRENETLQKELIRLRDRPDAYRDTIGQYQVIGAEVISNSFNRSANFLTIGAGKMDSVEAGMGVISSFGVVGQVKSVSNHFASVYSLLHPKLLISSKVKRTNTNCTVQWEQRDYLYAGLKYIPRHIKLLTGDSIVTSGFNSVFPEGVLIGVIEEFRLQDEMTFYEAKVKLSTDFTSLDYVYVIKDLLKAEKDSLDSYESN